MQCLLSENPQERLQYPKILKQLEQIFKQNSLQKTRNLSLKQINNFFSSDQNNAIENENNDKKITELMTKLRDQKNINSVEQIKKLQLICYGQKKLFQFKKAIETQLKILKICEKNQITDILTEAQYLLAYLYYEQGQLNDAKQYFELSLENTQKLKNQKYEKIADCLSSLGSVYKELQDFNKAKFYYENSLQIILDKCGQNDLQLSDIYNNLAVIQMNLGQIQESIDLFNKSINITKKIKGEDDPQMSLLYSNLGCLYLDQDNFEMAELWLDKALQQNIKTFGEISVQVSDCLTNKGVLQMKKQNLQEAETLFLKTEKIYEKIYSLDFWQINQKIN
ncbi:hypothetical protein PPERSA_03575 [Pseudocohnilembus persalinus]|uniref:Uncharacterized protein n=1 Tax=Pseudocohnilembus persalinus TaxID=266149 RepID=A0A0V0QPT9_PSEPJ|nr:hypothetical protein PPERSA_03575 [Pseudocohnilembus persalinus]|eukprot:KRX04335.1 hypothetical protein PPERSA_03575 [Pseudocohnilembus persalinus]